MLLKSKKPKFLEFTESVNKFIGIDKKTKTKIEKTFQILKDKFLEHNFHLKKVGEFAYNTLTDFDKKINLEMVLIKYYPSSKANPFPEMIKNVKSIIGKFNLKLTITYPPHDMYVKFSYIENGITISFRMLYACVRKIGKIEKFFVNENYVVAEDGVLEITESGKKANKISSGILNALKKLIKFVMKDDFEYYYFLDMLILRGGNEFLANKLNNFMEHKLYDHEKKQGKEVDLLKLFSENKLRSGILKNVDYREAIAYIISRIGMTNTFYFSEFNFENEEMFDGISRYSLFSNSQFKLPTDYFSGIKFCDIKNYDSMYEYQKGISNENGYSKIIFDRARDNDAKYLCSPIMRTVPIGFALYKKGIITKSSALYKKLDSSIAENINTLRQREGMEALNKIAHNGITSLQNKINYLEPYFDRKYPMTMIDSAEELVKTIIDMVDKISEDDYLLGYDN